DGNTSNDLIYIPKNATDINLIDVGSYSKATQTGTTTGTASDPRTASQIWNQLNNYINQDHYLAQHRGGYAQSNAAVYPFFKRLDLNVTQNIYFFTKNGDEKNKHTLSLSMDLINAGNFLNKYWGIQRAPSITNVLKFEGMAADGTTPLFSFPYADAKNQIPLVNSYTDNTSIISRWQMQFGIRYLFN
ncbi:MAG: TonB-dependent receptor, partial [Ginsengibacter sp.]